MNYYAISDIHGYLNELKKSMEVIDFKKNSQDKLVLLGDYIDGGDKSCETLYYIKDLSQKYEKQVVVLRGNHEELFLEWLSNPIESVHWLVEDRGFKTIKTFITQKQFDDITNKLKRGIDIFYISKLIANSIKENHKELIKWISKLQYYFETDKQIFVHAGIDEEAEELWKYGTLKEYFVNKFPATMGYFYKDIIAGHIGTSELRTNKECHEVYWDGQNHYYIDGTVQVSRFIPVLKYDTRTTLYTSFRKLIEENNIWEEYKILKDNNE